MMEVYDSLFGFKVPCDFNNCLGLSDASLGNSVSVSTNESQNKLNMTITA